MKTLISFLLLTISICSLAQLPKPINGEIRRIENFPSKFIDPKNVDIWLPENYDGKKKYAVLYMHDGQMLFDSTLTWNKQEWMVDENLDKLFKTKKIKECIVVGPWNHAKLRYNEYFPQKALNYMPAAAKDSIFRRELNGNPQADNYLKFLVKELKPYIDSSYSVYTDQKNTFVAGSSMGGLISMYAICEYPEVFAGAGCLSTHWLGIMKKFDPEVAKAFNAYMSDKLPSPKKHKIYFDYGTKTLDSLYKPFQLEVDKIMKTKGYTSKNWITREFVGENHSEKSWSKRLDIPFLFLMKKD